MPDDTGGSCPPVRGAESHQIHLAKQLKDTSVFIFSCKKYPLIVRVRISFLLLLSVGDGESRYSAASSSFSPFHFAFRSVPSQNTYSPCVSFVREFPRDFRERLCDPRRLLQIMTIPLLRPSVLRRPVKLPFKFENELAQFYNSQK